jgi:hypothetical protein
MSLYYLLYPHCPCSQFLHCVCLLHCSDLPRRRSQSATLTTSMMLPQFIPRPQQRKPSARLRLLIRRRHVRTFLFTSDPCAMHQFHSLLSAGRSETASSRCHRRPLDIQKYPQPFKSCLSPFSFPSLCLQPFMRTTISTGKTP